MLNKEQKKYITIVNILNNNLYKYIPLGDINSQLIINLIQNNLKINIKNILKIFFYLFFVQAIPNLQINKNDYNKNIIGDFLQLRNDLEKETKENLKDININTNNFLFLKKSDTNYFKIKFSFFISIKNIISTYKVINNNFKLNLFQKIYILIELNYNLKLINYFINIFQDFKPKIFISTNHIDKNHIILYNIFKTNKTKTISIQHGKNLYLDINKLQSNEAQILNINTDILYVHGKYYKELFNKYSNNKLKIKKINTKINTIFFNNLNFKKNIFVFLDGPYKGYIENNYKLINIVKYFCEKNNFYFFVKKHPLDKNNYKFKSNKLLKKLNQNNNIYYITHNSGIYIDFIKKGNFIIKLLTGNNDLNININKNDSFKNENELKNILNKDGNILIKKNLEISKEYF